MYEKLTTLIKDLEADTYGEWHGGLKDRKSPDDPIQMPFVAYSERIHSLLEEVYAFHDEHPDFRLNEYATVLEENGLQWKSESLENAEISNLDGNTVMAMLMGVIRADRFTEGTLLSFCKSGHISNWLRRLQEIDQEKCNG